MVEEPKWDYSSPCSNCGHPAWIGDKRAIDYHRAWHTGDGECQGRPVIPIGIDKTKFNLKELLIHIFMKCGCKGYKPSLVLGPPVFIKCELCNGTGKLWRIIPTLPELKS